MGQVLIRNVDDDTLAAYREQAARNQRSLEAELRHVLSTWKPLGAERRAELQTQFAELRAKTLKVPQTPSEVIIRELRGS